MCEFEKIECAITLPIANGLRWMVRGGSSWRLMPHDLPPWNVVYQQTQRWFKAQVFEAIAHDLRAVLRIADGQQETPTAAIFDSRMLQSAVESRAAAGLVMTAQSAGKATKFT